MSNDYGSRKKKTEMTCSDWPSEIKFKPTEHKDLSHAYEYITGIVSIIRYQ